MKAALYFDSADGFGEWRIFIGTAAEASLREHYKRSKKAFGIIVKKIRSGVVAFICLNADPSLQGIVYGALFPR